MCCDFQLHFGAENWIALHFGIPFEIKEQLFTLSSDNRIALFQQTVQVCSDPFRGYPNRSVIIVVVGGIHSTVTITNSRTHVKICHLNASILRRRRAVQVPCFVLHCAIIGGWLHYRLALCRRKSLTLSINCIYGNRMRGGGGGVGNQENRSKSCTRALVMSYCLFFV